MKKIINWFILRQRLLKYNLYSFLLRKQTVIFCYPEQDNKLNFTGEVVFCTQYGWIFTSDGRENLSYRRSKSETV